jgi:hypothetical protein
VTVKFKRSVDECSLCARRRLQLTYARSILRPIEGAEVSMLGEARAAAQTSSKLALPRRAAHAAWLARGYMALALALVAFGCVEDEGDRVQPPGLTGSGGPALAADAAWADSALALPGAGDAATSPSGNDAGLAPEAGVAIAPSDAASPMDASMSGHEHVGDAAIDAAMQHCLALPAPDPRDELLTGQPREITVGASRDLLVPELVEKWMDENEFAQAHDGWHLVRKWDQGCRRSNAPAQGCASAQRLLNQGLTRAPIQQGAPGDGLAFMAMHRHMIQVLKATFPKHSALFAGFKKVPRSKADAENPTPWRNVSWSADNIKGFDTLENIEQNLSMFDSEDALGNYIENTYRWTAQSPTSPANLAGDGLHGVLHSQWSVNGSPANLIDQAVDVKNHSFWKLHGWIDDVWERYRKAKGLKDDDAAYRKILLEQCMEMHALMPKNRGKTPTTGGGPDAGVPETGVFAQTVRPIFDSVCGGCHSAIGPNAGLTLGGPGISSAEIRDGVVGVMATNGQYALIEPGAPEKSWIYLKASGEAANATCTAACDRDIMPPSGTRLSAAQLSTLRAWIMSGATAN